MDTQASSPYDTDNFDALPDIIDQDFASLATGSINWDPISTQDFEEIVALACPYSPDVLEWLEKHGQEFAELIQEGAFGTIFDPQPGPESEGFAEISFDTATHEEQSATTN